MNLIEMIPDKEEEIDERPYIKMMALAEVKIKNEELNFNKRSFSVGGYSFNCKNSNNEDTDLLFDFDAFTISPREDNDIEIIGGKGLFFDEYHISKVYENMMSDSEFSINDVSAEILANTSMIGEFFFEIDDTYVECFMLKKLAFEDENGTEYVVSDKVLDEFNNNWEGRI